MSQDRKDSRRKSPNIPEMGGIEIDNTPRKFKKETKEREQREQEATRESD